MESINASCDVVIRRSSGDLNSMNDSDSMNRPQPCETTRAQTDVSLPRESLVFSNNSSIESLPVSEEHLTGAT